MHTHRNEVTYMHLQKHTESNYILTVPDMNILTKMYSHTVMYKYTEDHMYILTVPDMKIHKNVPTHMQSQKYAHTPARTQRIICTY